MSINYDKIFQKEPRLYGETQLRLHANYPDHHRIQPLLIETFIKPDGREIYGMIIPEKTKKLIGQRGEKRLLLCYQTEEHPYTSKSRKEFRGPILILDQ